MILCDSLNQFAFLLDICIYCNRFLSKKWNSQYIQVPSSVGTIWVKIIQYLLVKEIFSTHI